MVFKHDAYNPIKDMLPEPYHAQGTYYAGQLQLRPGYQVEGRDWLKSGERRWLTDKPGLGKTLQSAEAAVRPVLVIAPTYLTRQWYDFLKKQYPFDRVNYCTGNLNRFQRQALLDEEAEWYIVNVQMMRVDDYMVPNFNMPESVKTVIIDEAHHVRNHKAKQSVGTALFTSDMSRRVYSLTATPMWKDASDLYMQLHITQPEIFDSHREFIDLFCIVDDTPYGPKILGVKKSMRKELRALLSSVALGRTYKDAGRHLPAIIKDTIKIEMPKVLKDKYDELKEMFRLQLENDDGDFDDAVLFSSYIAVLHSLRTFTNFKDKQDALVERMTDVGKAGVVFCWYKDVAYDLGDMLNKVKDGRKTVVLTGDIEPEQRQKAALEAMRNGWNVVATMSSLSEGVNLYDYRYVGFYECDYPPGRNEQTLGRVVRDRNDEGKDQEPVIVDYYIVEDTIDEVIYNVSQRREASIRSVMVEALL